jgi:hypothetical protein
LDIQKINQLVAEKIMGLVPQVDFGTRSEHDWELDEDGEIDTFAFEVDNHNGPACKRCFYSYCHHCQNGPDKPCKVDAPNYAESISLAWKVVEKLKDKHLFKLAQSLEGKWYADFSDNQVYDESAKIAICLAALKAEGIEL